MNWLEAVDKAAKLVCSEYLKNMVTETEFDEMYFPLSNARRII